MKEGLQLTCRPPDFQPVPASPRLRSEWVESNVNLAAAVSLYGSTSLKDALDMQPDFVAQFFKSKSFTDWRKNEEGKTKLQAAVVNRLNDVIRGQNNLAKGLSRMR